MSDTSPHLRQIAANKVADLCDRAFARAGNSHTVRLEIEGFRKSRTPWDATRLANILWRMDKANPLVEELVRDLDQAAEDCAECVPSNRDSERL